ncbi:uncharacterized protein LOC109806083 isoform X1 [Cajanus cajan]|uniref:uncharacterized protein LOC109806083 isoform X1 n=1 Tax=Cajanus cajan TaxID=3821 RepID=UPI0010FB7904|nr:uncharacterized protein LOC109806083 isoform X1 [Cajanus cajan]
MPWARLSGSPRVDVAIDMGNPFLNLTVDGFLKIGTVAATRAAAEDTYHIIQKSLYQTNSTCLFQGISQVMILRKRNCSWRLCWNGIWGREDPGHQRLGNSLHRVVGLTLCPNYQHHIWLLKECHDWGCINRGPGLCCQQQQERQSCHRCNYGGSNSYCCRIHKLPHLNE